MTYRTMRRNHILDLMKQGLTYRQIGKEIGISRQRVHQIAKNYNPQKLRTEPNPPQN